jgi:hypothetical protein
MAQTRSILSQIDDFLAMAGPPVLRASAFSDSTTTTVTPSYDTETAWTLPRAASILPAWMRLTQKCGCLVEMAAPVKGASRKKSVSVRALTLANPWNFPIFLRTFGLTNVFSVPQALVDEKSTKRRVEELRKRAAEMKRARSE